jgi:hypothetical protein
MALVAVPGAARPGLQRGAVRLSLVRRPSISRRVEPRRPSSGTSKTTSITEKTGLGGEKQTKALLAFGPETLAADRAEGRLFGLLLLVSVVILTLSALAGQDLLNAWDSFRGLVERCLG